MQIVDNRALVVRTRDPDKITRVITDSRVVKKIPVQDTYGYEVAVKWTLPNTKILHNLGFKKAPSPILGRYDWPGLLTPFQHQKDTAAFLTMNRRAYCWNEQGSGKSATAAWAADYLMRKGVINRVLIVCPLSIMDSAWRADLFKTVMNRRVAIAHGTKDKRISIVESDAEIVIINYDGVETVQDALLRGGFDLIILDEATQIKTSTTRKWRAINKLVDPTTWLWLMTGTPTAQSPLDAYGLAKMVDPKSVPPYFGSFRDKVMLKVSQFRYIPKPEAKDILHKILQPAIRYTKEECMDLPEVLYTERSAPMTAQQEKYYKKLTQDLLIQIADSDISAVNAAAQINKLLQIACIKYNTPVLTDSGWVPIQEVTPAHRVWDGEEWVTQGGAIFRGAKEVKECWGVHMTSDHKVLTTIGWQTAEDILHGKSSERLIRAAVRLPDGYSASGDNNRNKCATKHTNKCFDRYSRGQNDHSRSCRAPRNASTNIECQTRQGTQRTTTHKTYDLINCGPRSRFVVLGSEGLLIVHNCGTVYSDTGEVIEFDCKHKLNEMLSAIRESSHKTLVFCNYRHSIDRVIEFLTKQGITNEAIHGGVNAKKRAAIFADFQTSPNPQVLVIQPQAAAHGVTLTAANTIVWFSPVTSAEIWLQANARVHRAGQRNPCLVVKLISSAVEKKLYKALEDRELTQSSLLSLYKNLLDIA